MSWQPIETAPRTGRTLLLGYFNEKGNWRTLRGQWFSAEEIEESWEIYDSPEGWYETPVEGEECFFTEPTHWQPLPEPPREQPSS